MQSYLLAYSRANSIVIVIHVDQPFAPRVVSFLLCLLLCRLLLLRSELTIIT